MELGEEWRARACIVDGKSDSRYHRACEPTAGPRTLTTGCFCNSALNAEFLFDGSLFALPGGDVRIGFGGGYRSNKLRYSQVRDGALVADFDVNRDSHFFFGEANIPVVGPAQQLARSEEHTSELQSLMRISYAVFCLKKKNNTRLHTQLS